MVITLTINIIMVKKIYKRPSAKVVKIDASALLADSPSAFSLNKEEVDEERPDDISDDIWGKQW